MRDYKKLNVYGQADQLVVDVYRCTLRFPSEERFGLAAQMRKSAVSMCSNIVEGSSRRSSEEYIRFLEIAYGSAQELGYQLSLAARLGYLDHTNEKLLDRCDHVATRLNRLLRAVIGMSRTRKPRAAYPQA
jgi:four helix bundle protein